MNSLHGKHIGFLGEK